MDNRKYYNTPRDRIDDRLLLQLLGEAEPETRSGIGTEYARGSSRSLRQGSAAPASPSAPTAPASPGCRCGDGNPPFPGSSGSIGQVGQSAKQEAFPANEGIRQGCRRDDRMAMTGFPLSMVYAPDQEWGGLYEENDALDKGTLFRELDLPFYPGCRCRPCQEARKDCGCSEKNER